MALLVWLPLRGDLKNLGLNDIEIINNNVNFNSSGKIGSCIKTTNSNQFKIITRPWMELNLSNSLSISMWIKYSGSSSYVIACTSYEIYFNSTRLGWRLGDGSGHSIDAYVSGTYSEDTWHHLTCTWDPNIKTISTYINGVLARSVKDTSTAAYKTISSTINFTYSNTYYINDLRMYDHCLSPKEVKEISKGLVLHYKLDGRIENNYGNLVINGSGEFGTTNWEYPSYISDDVPSGSGALLSFTNNNQTIDFIPYSPSVAYTFESYVKSTSTTGTSYPALIPYDIDKYCIHNPNTRSGFNLGTMTTITLTLNPGDTKIYVLSLSSWNANSGHYYNYAAIFGYRDSTGHLYPDGVYTRTIPSFGNGTDQKINLDKTNNIITLNSPYTGRVVEVGTSICAAAAGSAYYYPFGGISNSSIQDWTYKSATIPINNNFLVAAKYLKVLIYGAKLTCIKLTNTTLSILVTDSSGYGNNGIITGTLITGNDSPRYNYSTLFISGAKITPSIFPSFLTDECTVSMWVKLDQLPSSSPGRTMLYTAWYGFSCEVTSSGSTYFRTYLTNGQKDSPSGTLTINNWIHWVGVKSSTGVSLYLNGTLIGTSLTTDNFNWKSVSSNSVASYNNNYYLYGKLSDLKLYATALSAEDIKELYNTSAMISNSNDMYGYLLEELPEVYNNLGLITYTDSIAISNDTGYSDTTAHYASSFSYSRMFTSTNWGTIILPVALNYEDWADNFTIAEISGVNVSLNNGELRSFSVKREILGEGSTTLPNKPYLIRSKVADSSAPLVISKNNCIVYPANPGLIEIVNGNYSFKFVGTYTGIDSPNLYGKYAMSGGQWIAGKTTSSMAPMRFYLEISNYNGNESSLFTEIAKLGIIKTGQFNEIQNQEVSIGKDPYKDEYIIANQLIEI